MAIPESKNDLITIHMYGKGKHFGGGGGGGFLHYIGSLVSYWNSFLDTNESYMTVRCGMQKVYHRPLSTLHNNIITSRVPIRKSVRPTDEVIVT